MTTRIACVFVLVALIVMPRGVRGDDAAAPDKSLSPYFFVEGAKPGIEALPLQRTKADVHITGMIADVVVTQTYRNDGDRTISARYVFPASTRAAVYGMKMKIGELRESLERAIQRRLSR